MDALPPPLDALHAALRAEQAAEVAELDALAARALPDRIAAGMSWPLLRVDSVERRGRKAAVVLRAPRGLILHDGLQSGDPIWLVRSGRRVPGRLTIVEARTAELRVDEEPEEGSLVEVQRRADPSTWVRYRQALERGAEGRHRLVKQLVGTEPLPDRGIAEGARLPGLDPAQQDAADHALRAEALAAIHGPPGTGKTHVLAAIAKHLVERGDRPWALADSNAAVDHLALTLHRAGIDVLRIGRPARMSDEVLPLSLEARLADSPLADALGALDRDIARADGRDRRALIERYRELHHQAEDHLLRSAQVIATTLGTLARRAEHLPHPHTALIDEATQATEPAVWAAIPWVKRIILVGDPEQLGPVARVPGPLATSLLERLLAEGRVEAPMLEVQHRMDPALRQLVAPVYGPRYRDAPSVDPQPLDRGGVRSTELTRRRSLWIDTAGAGFDDAVDEVSRSTFNEGEVRIVAEVVRQLLDAGVQADAIGVITPYSAQVARIESAVGDAIEVATVNAFQGQERPVIVASWVRSNPEGELGFVADGRRLTVTLTRARSLLVQVGDTATLCGHPRFQEVVDPLAERGDLQSVFEPPWIDVAFS